MRAGTVGASQLDVLKNTVLDTCRLIFPVFSQLTVDNLACLMRLHIRYFSGWRAKRTVKEYNTTLNEFFPFVTVLKAYPLSL